MVITAIGFGRSPPAAICAAAARTTSLRQGNRALRSDTPTRAGRLAYASVDQTEARCEVASSPETVESPFMLTNLLRC